VPEQGEALVYLEDLRSAVVERHDGMLVAERPP